MSGSRANPSCVLGASHASRSPSLGVPKPQRSQERSAGSTRATRHRVKSCPSHQNRPSSKWSPSPPPLAPSGLPSRPSTSSRRTCAPERDSLLQELLSRSVSGLLHARPHARTLPLAQPLTHYTPRVFAPPCSLPLARTRATLGSTDAKKGTWNRLHARGGTRADRGARTTGALLRDLGVNRSKTSTTACRPARGGTSTIRIAEVGGTRMATRTTGGVVGMRMVRNRRVSSSVVARSV